MSLMNETVRTNPIDRTIIRVAALFGRHSKEVERFLKFSVVGVIGALVDFGMLNLLQLTLLVPVPPQQQAKIALATGVAFCSAVTSNFLWNRYWTYPDSRSRSLRRQLAIFFTLNAVGLVFRLAFVSITFHALGDVGATFVENLELASATNHEALSYQLGTNMAQAISTVIVMMWNFFANRYWTYNDV